MSLRVRLVPLIGVLVATVLALPGAVHAQVEEPDPAEFTPAGYTFCGWRDFENGTWAMKWREELRGAYSMVFARGMTCASARRHWAKTKYKKEPPYSLYRAGYRCKRIVSGHELDDTRCTKVGNARVAFRIRSGA